MRRMNQVNFKNLFVEVVWLVAFYLLVSISDCPTSNATTQDRVPEHDTFQVESKVLGENRVICVWTPPAYRSSKKNYPVLYMPDGGVKEDFPHIANTVKELVADKTIPPTILVGIENTQRRRDLTGPSEVKADERIAPISDGASQFRKFISDELFPEIKGRYRVTGERAIIGESAAGLFVVETLLLQPKMFTGYMAVDPAIYWNNGYLVSTAKDHLDKFPHEKKRFWFAGSNASDIQINTRKLGSILVDKAPESLRWKYLDQPNEKHSTIFRATKEAALKWTLGSNPDNR